MKSALILTSSPGAGLADDDYSELSHESRAGKLANADSNPNGARETWEPKQKEKLIRRFLFQKSANSRHMNWISEIGDGRDGTKEIDRLCRHGSIYSPLPVRRVK